MTKANSPSGSPNDKQSKKSTKSPSNCSPNAGNNSKKSDRNDHGVNLPDQQKRVPYTSDRDSTASSQTRSTTPNTSKRAPTRNVGLNPAQGNDLVTHNLNSAKSSPTTGTPDDPTSKEDAHIKASIEQTDLNVDLNLMD